jgi:hypothetical protein
VVALDAPQCGGDVYLDGFDDVYMHVVTSDEGVIVDYWEGDGGGDGPTATACWLYDDIMDGLRVPDDEDDVLV